MGSTNEKRFENFFLEILNNNKENEILSDFKDLIRWLWNESHRRGYPVSYGTGESSSKSITSHYEEGGGSIRIAYGTVGLNLLWDLIHEFGHVLLGKPMAEHKGEYYWERKAWDKGWEAASSCSERIWYYHDCFETRQSDCLSSYQPC